MPISNYPNGFANGLTIRGLPIYQSHPGEVFWVNNSSVLAKGGIGGSDSNAGTFLQPFSTIDFAIGQCTSARGDIIMVMPGHAETISTATFALAGINQDVDGVAVVGLGVGSMRPTITFDTDNDATWAVTGDHCSISNIKFIGNFLSVKAAITNSAGAGMTVEHCRFEDTSATLGLIAAVLTTVSTNSDDLWVSNCQRHSIATTTPGTLVKILNTTAGVTISDNSVFHTVLEENAAMLLSSSTLVITQLMMERNNCYSINIAQTTSGFLIASGATTGSGIVRNNMVRSQDPSAAIMITAAAIQFGSFENYHAGETTQLSGAVLPDAGAQ